MKKVNLLVEHTGASQLAYYMIENSNKLVTNGDAAVCCFYEFLQQPCRQKLFPSFNLLEAWSQEGITIATTLQLAQSMLDWPGPNEFVYYLWDIGWLLYPRQVNSFGQYELLHNEKLKVVCRCQDHADVLINNYSVHPSFVFDNFDYCGMKNMIERIGEKK